MRILIFIVFISFIFLNSVPSYAKTDLPDQKKWRGWVQAMKSSPRGPFKYLRWFCNDGTVQPPKEYACKDHGGGVQHGAWTDQVKVLRENGFYIANIFADIKPEQFLQNPDHPDMIKQMIVEQFLIHADDGWILRRARFYRGALQAEDEAANGRNLLLALAAEPYWTEKYFVLREAVKFFPHGRKGAPISEMRQLSLAIAEQDKNFESLRIKIHVKPELSDAGRVREYAAERGRVELANQYERLAVAIENVFKPSDIRRELRILSRQIKSDQMKRLFNQRSGQLTPDNRPWIRFAAACRLMATLRSELVNIDDARHMLAYLDVGLSLEDELFRSSNDLLLTMNEATIRQRLLWLKEASAALYGSGLLTERQWQALRENFDRLTQSQILLVDYKSGLDYAALVPGWADRAMRFHFTETVERLSVIEPISRRYVHDRLRSSLLLFYAAVLDSLLADMNKKLGVQTNLFGQQIPSGLRALNPGLSRGVLRALSGDEPTPKFERDGIYVLPATTADLPPVAGIVTAGKGNILSHVQLLARNLGIPNVSVDQNLLPQISSHDGQNVVLAVSPGGVVQLVDDGPQWQEKFPKKKAPQPILIRADLDKMILDRRDVVSLKNLRSHDSGRITGPKAANLGELKNHFPDTVSDGLVIPFGLYRALLEQPLEPGGPSMFSWMQEQYRLIESLRANPQEQEVAVSRFLTRVRDWITNADPGEAFRERLRAAMEETFGPDGSYGVFVRSDTNVEDTPGFTGAGLNLTVPHVVGFDNVLEAISRVWASPFSERAYAWRQAYMDKPEHVYASVLLQKSVPAEKSGVLVTVDVNSGQTGWLTVVVSEGVGGAVSNQTAEEIRIQTDSGKVRFMAHATEPNKLILLRTGGVTKIPASGAEYVLTPDDIKILADFAVSVPQRFPKMLDTEGRAVPADIEFGFYRNKLVLFQIRPFLESRQAQKNTVLNDLDRDLSQKHQNRVNLDEIPGS
jgi:phosphohistidine swiveling domain-containing protein